jgi:hypothetical protein
MSRAFVKEDRDDIPIRYSLPPRDDPSFLVAAAWALLEGANQGDSIGAERATGHRWGDPLLRPAMEQILAEARRRGDDRMEQLAERFLSA